MVRSFSCNSSAHSFFFLLSVLAANLGRKKFPQCPVMMLAQVVALEPFIELSHGFVFDLIDCCDLSQLILHGSVWVLHTHSGVRHHFEHIKETNDIIILFDLGTLVGIPLSSSLLITSWWVH
jgi:hypothetical protein